MSVSSSTRCAWGVYVHSLANIKLDLPASSRGYGSWPEYQVGGRSVMGLIPSPRGLINVVCMRVKCVSVCTLQQTSSWNGQGLRRGAGLTKWPHWYFKIQVRAAGQAEGPCHVLERFVDMCMLLSLDIGVCVSAREEEGGSTIFLCFM